MKFTTATTDLRRIVGAAARAANRDSSWLSVLTGVRLEADEDTGVTATGTDLDVTITTECDTEVAVPGVAVIPAQRLRATLDKIKGDTVTVTVADEEATVIAGRARVRLRCLPVEEWPQLAPVDGDGQHLDPETWARIGRVLVAASTDNARPIICGLRFDPGDDEHPPAAVCTDSYRLAWCEVGDGGLDALVPARAVAEARRLNPDEVTVATGDSWATFTGPGGTVTARLVDGDFPNWRRLWPDEVDRSPVTATFDADGMADALAIGDTVRADGSATRIVVGDKHIEVDANGADVGDAATHLDANTDGAPITVGVNPAFFGDLLRSVAPDGGAVQLHITDDRKPMWTVGTNGVRHLLMPVQIP